jgi:hypothetical protein
MDSLSFPRRRELRGNDDLFLPARLRGASRQRGRNPNGYHSPPVIPAKAGIQVLFLSPALERRAMDSLSFPRRRELRGNDDLFLPARLQAMDQKQELPAPASSQFQT